MINKITFTGIDNWTNIEELKIFQKKYPFVEFGVLISLKNTNFNTNNRYPELNILNNLKKNELNLSLHICGKIARDIVKKNDWTDFNSLMGKKLELFDRYQLNISNMNKFSKEISFPENKKIIIQSSSNNHNLFDFYSNMKNIYFFLDNSGGKGLEEEKWINKKVDYMGYAGGLCLENIESKVKEINEIRNEKYWIDMESSIRKNDIFNINICEKICLKLLEKKLIDI